MIPHITDVTTIAPIGPRKDCDQPRNMKPRTTNSSVIGAAIQNQTIRRPPVRRLAPSVDYRSRRPEAPAPTDMRRRSRATGTPLMARARSNSAGLGQFNASIRRKLLRAIRIVIQSTATRADTPQWWRCLAPALPNLHQDTTVLGPIGPPTEMITIISAVNYARRRQSRRQSPCSRKSQVRGGAAHGRRGGVAISS